MPPTKPAKKKPTARKATAKKAETPKEITPKPGNATAGKKKRPGIENLRVPTSEQAREYGRRGGLASAEARQKKKTASEIVGMILEQRPELQPGTVKMLERLGIEEKNPELKVVAFASLVTKMITGDLEATKIVLKLLGEMPSDFSINNIVQADNVVISNMEKQKMLDQLTDEELAQFEKINKKLTIEEDQADDGV